MATLTTSASLNPVPESPQAREGLVQFHAGRRGTVERTRLSMMWNPVRNACIVYGSSSHINTSQMCN